MDENGTKVFEASYDVWGKQTVTLNAIGLHCGYTGHEMLMEFDIINMNGRLYDPVLGRFFSPDNYVQMPDNSQNFNRYNYCLNNPLKYTDPSGNLFGIDDAVIAFAVFNMASSMMQAAYNGESVWKAGGLSLLSLAASYGIRGCFRQRGQFWQRDVACRIPWTGKRSGLCLGRGKLCQCFCFRCRSFRHRVVCEDHKGSGDLADGFFDGSNGRRGSLDFWR